MWKRKKLNIPANPNELGPLLNSTFGPIVSTLETLVDALELLKSLLLAYEEPFFSKLARGLKGTLISLSNTGMYVCHVLPDIDRVISTEEALDLLAESILDPFDIQRPIAEGTAYVDMVMFAIESGSLGGVLEILRLIDQLIRVPYINLDYDLARWNTPGDTYTIVEGEGQYPDWVSANAYDLFPFLQDATASIIQVLDLFIIEGNWYVIEQAIAILQEKIAIINQLIAAINLLRDTYLSILNIGDLLVYRIQGEHDQGSLAGEVIKARAELDLLREERSGVILTQQTLDTSVLVEVRHKQEGNVVGGVIALAASTVDSTIFDVIFGVD